MKALLIFLLGLAVGYVIAPAPKTLAPKVKVLTRVDTLTTAVPAASRPARPVPAPTARSGYIQASMPPGITSWAFYASGGEEVNAHMGEGDHDAPGGDDAQHHGGHGLFQAHVQKCRRQTAGPGAGPRQGDGDEEPEA